MNRWLRGPTVSRLLRRLGIDPRHYWLLMDLFHELSERREMLTQLGREGATLKVIVWLYFAIMGLLSLVYLAIGADIATYFLTFLGASAFVLMAVLVPETSNSVVNPVEGIVLAHQPINGATYTAAKLSHLARILLYLVPGLNALPALLGLWLKGARWFYPLLHMLAALALGVTIAALSCAVFGWLVRFVPAPRLKAAGQITEMLPWAFYVAFQFGGTSIRHLHFTGWLPATSAGRLYLGAACGIASLAIIVFGLRSLGGDYLVRVSSIVHGGSGAKTKPRRSRLASIVARVFGGPPSRAGFEYVSKMMIRDWQFRRQLIPAIPMFVAPAAIAFSEWKKSPFHGDFTAAHLVPHAFGVVLFVICTTLRYGSDYKGTWLFLLAPNRAFGPFARGVYAVLWLKIVLIPLLVLACYFTWAWGVADGLLFSAYSLAVGSLYLGLELRLIEGIPFGKQMDVSRGAFVLPMMIAGGAVVGVAVVVQYLVFLSRVAVVLVTVIGAVAAFYLTRSSIASFETSIRHHLGLISRESTLIYKEVDA